MGFLDDINPINHLKRAGKMLGLDKLGQESESDKKKRENLNLQGQAASDFANQGQDAFIGLRAGLGQTRDMLRDQATGKVSLSSEQLRQGLQQQLAAQRAQQASASPANAAMAARLGMNNMARAAYGMSGQAATAGLAERMAAAKALSDFQLGERQQELQAALGSRQTAVSAYGGTPAGKSTLEQYQPAFNAAAAVLPIIASDERGKIGMHDASARADAATRRIDPLAYRYKDPRNGAGEQLGVSAQALERAGLGHTVLDTPRGKVVDGAKAATTGLALTAALARRVSKLEDSKRDLAAALARAQRR